MFRIAAFIAVSLTVAMLAPQLMQNVVANAPAEQEAAPRSKQQSTRSEVNTPRRPAAPWS